MQTQNSKLRFFLGDWEYSIVKLIFQFYLNSRTPGTNETMLKMVLNYMISYLKKKHKVTKLHIRVKSAVKLLNS